MAMDLDDLAASVRNFVASCEDARAQAAEMLFANSMLMQDCARVRSSMSGSGVCGAEPDALQLQVADSMGIFIGREIQLGLTFLDRATTSANAETRDRNARYALTAYDTAKRFLRNPILMPQQRKELRPALEVLRLELQQVREVAEKIR